MADYQSALRSITYLNTSETPDPIPRSISFTTTDGSAQSNTHDQLVIVLPVNDVPVLSGVSGASISYLEGSGAVPLSAALMLQDADNVNIASASVQITGNFNPVEDILSAVTFPGISSVFDQQTGTLSLSGSAPLADYQSVLQSVSYANTSANPDLTVRTVTYTVSDGQSVSNGFTGDIVIQPVNDAPNINSIGAAPGTFVENSAGVLPATTLSLLDIDSSHLQSATVSIINNYNPGEDSLLFTNQSGITGIFDTSTGVLALTGNATVASYEDALRTCLLYTSPSPRDQRGSRMPSSA